MKAGLDAGRKRRRGVRQYLRHRIPLIATVAVGTLVGAITLASGQTRSPADDGATAQKPGIALSLEKQSTHGEVVNGQDSQDFSRLTG